MTPCKSNKFSEIEDLLQGIKQRRDSKDKTLNMPCVDDCYGNVRNKYNQIFPGTKVKLNLFHACQRITKTLNKAKTIANSFMREFSEEKKYTPAKEQLEKNLNSLIERWINVPAGPLGNPQTTREIEHLRLHIQKGCLLIYLQGVVQKKTSGWIGFLNVHLSLEPSEFLLSLP